MLKKKLLKLKYKHKLHKCDKCTTSLFNRLRDK